jgi:glycosyltransferase involved in cell wall biosynthesis
LAYCQAVVVVDDCSDDTTASVALGAGAYVLRHVMNRGQGAALQTGVDFALNNLQADIVVHFDADGQMRGDEIPAMTAPILAGKADVVLGSRFLGAAVENMPLTRKITNRLGLYFTMLVSGIALTDTHNGFRAFSARAARELRITLDRMAHASEILDLIAMKKVRYVEVPVHIRYSQETLEKSRAHLGSSLTRALRVVKDVLIKKIMR